MYEIQFHIDVISSITFHIYVGLCGCTDINYLILYIHLKYSIHLNINLFITKMIKFLNT
jgi:hypothetical protein